MNTIALQLRYRAPAPVRLKLAQANAVRLSCEWADAATLPAAFDLVAEIHTSRTVAPGSTPLAAQLVPNLTSASADPWVIEFSGAQLNHPIPNPPTRRLWMVVYLRTASAPVTVAAAEIELEYHAISGITPAPPTPAIYLTPEAAAELFASIDDVDALTDRVTSLEQMEGGGAQADWNATTGPSVILNKPSLGNSSSRNTGTGAGDVATGNHTHSSTSQIAGLDTALAGKADLSGGKLLASQLPDLAITQWLGTAANQSAMLALVGQRGDWCARTDDGKVYIVTAEPSSSIGNWTSLSYPTAPVLSVAGRTGSITLGIGDINGLQGVLDVKVNSDALQALAFRDTIGTGQIDDGAVTNGKLSVMAAATLKGSIAGGTPADLTAAQVTALLDNFTSAFKGLVPASAGGTTNFLRADGAWGAPPTGGSPGGGNGQLQFNNAGSFNGVSGSIVSGSELTLAGGISLVNPTAATVGVQQSSPVLRLQGAGWTTGSGGVSRATEWRAYHTSIAGTTNPTTHLWIEGRVSGGGWVQMLRFQTGENGNNIFANGTSIDVGNISCYQIDCTGTVRVGGTNFGVRVRSGDQYQFSSSSSNSFTAADLFLGRRAAANLRLGAADASTGIVAQTISVQSATGENISAAAAVFSLDGAQGTGTAAGGDVRIRVSPNGSTGSSQNALTEAVRFRATDLATQCAGAVIASGPVVLPSFTVSTVPSASLWTRGLIYVTDDVGGSTPAFSDGTNWRRVADRAVVSTP